MGAFNSFIGSIGGRKFVMALAAVIAIVLQSKFGISDTQVMYVAGIACTFIFGQGFSDGLSKGATSTVAQLSAPEDKSGT